VNLTTHLHLVPTLRMRAALSPLVQYVFMALCLVKHKEHYTFTVNDITHYSIFRMPSSQAYLFLIFLFYIT
jgi:fatty-acid desaturase